MASSDIILNIATRGAALAKQQLSKLGGAGAKSGAQLAALSKYAKIAGLAIGVALVKGIGSALKEFTAFDDKMTQSLAIMKTNIEQQEAMVQAARRVSTETRISAQDSAEAYFFLASAGLDAEQSISALPQVARFAQAGMFDMATATDLATDAQSALGLTVSDAEQNLENLTRVTDVLVKGNTLANASVQQFSEALTTKAGAALKVVNKDIEEGVAVLAVFADRGVKGAEAGDKLNQVLRDIPRATAKNSEEFAKLGLEMFDAQGNMKNVADIIEELDAVLGPMSDEMKAATLDQLGLNRGVADAVKILSGTTNQIREYEAALRDASGTTQEIADNQMKSLQAELDVVSNKWSVYKQLVGEDFEGAARIGVGWLDRILERLIDIKTAQDEGVDSALGYTYQWRTVTHQLTNSTIRTQELVRVTKDLEKSHDDERDAVEAYNASLEDLRPSIEQVEEATRNAKEAEEELVKERQDKALGALMNIQNAYNNLNEIYEHHNELKEKELEKEEALSKIRGEQTATEEKLQKAIEEANDLAEDGTEITNEESLAIERQKKRIQELIDIEDKDKIQKLELAVAKEKLIELEEEAIERSRESLAAEEKVAKIREELIKLEEREKEALENLNEATEEYNEATAKTPENLLEIAIAKKELDTTLEDMNSLGAFAEGIDQMVKFAGGRFQDLLSHFQKITSTRGKSVDEMGLGSGSINYDNEGLAGVSSGVGSGASAVEQGRGNITTINQIKVDVDGALTDRVGIEQAVASALIQAQKRGMKVIL